MMIFAVVEEGWKGEQMSLIERQAAIDAVNNAFDRETLLTGFVLSIAVRAIRNMPSAQPEERTMEEFMYGQDMGNPEDGSL